MAIKGRSGNVISGNFCGNEALPKDRDFRRHNHAVTCLASREGEPTERERWGRRQKCSRGAWGLPVCAVQALRSSDAACLLCTSHEHTCIAVISHHWSRVTFCIRLHVACGVWLRNREDIPWKATPETIARKQGWQSRKVRSGPRRSSCSCSTRTSPSATAP